LTDGALTADALPPIGPNIKMVKSPSEKMAKIDASRERLDSIRVFAYSIGGLALATPDG
jgi:hypothetical protein